MNGRMNPTGSSAPERLSADVPDRAVGKNLRRARLSADLTRTECAEKIDVPVEIFRACEAGRHHLSAEQLAALAILLSVPVASLLDDNTLAAWQSQSVDPRRSQ